MVAYTLHQKAKDDLEGIWRYTCEQWGRDQADTYFRLITDKFQWLAEHPKAGMQRNDIKPGYYCIPTGSHLVFYRLMNSQPDIIRVVHQRADVISWLNRP